MRILLAYPVLHPRACVPERAGDTARPRVPRFPGMVQTTEGTSSEQFCMRTERPRRVPWRSNMRRARSLARSLRGPRFGPHRGPSDRVIAYKQWIRPGRRFFERPSRASTHRTVQRLRTRQATATTLHLVTDHQIRVRGVATSLSIPGALQGEARTTPASPSAYIDRLVMGQMVTSFIMCDVHAMLL